MGDPKFARRHYTTPSHPWDGARISEENQIIYKYGLKNKRELWKTQTMLREIRAQARELQARLRTDDEQAPKEIEALIGRLGRLGLLHGDAELNDVLSLEVEALLARRLQTQIYLKGLARTVKHARQLIVHGHIAIDGQKMTVPSYLVKEAEMENIDYYFSSPMVSDMHPERPAADFKPEMTTVKEERRVAEDREREMRRGRELERIAAMRRAIRGEDDEDEDSDEDIEKVDADEDGEGAEDSDEKGAKDGDPAKKGEKGAKDEDPAEKGGKGAKDEESTGEKGGTPGKEPEGGEP